MNKFLYTLIITIALSCNSYSQNEYSNSNLHINSSIGFATLEIENALKLNTISKEFFIGIDVFKIKEDMLIYSGLEYTDISGNYANSGTDTFISNKYISLPIVLRYKKIGDNNLDFFIDVGMYGSYLFNTKSETLAQFNSENGVGFNLGLLANIGASYRFDETWKFTVGLRSKADFLNNSKDDLPEYKIEDLYAINIGFNISL